VGRCATDSVQPFLFLIRLSLLVGLWSSGRITKSDINTFHIISRFGTVIGILGLWADVQLTACSQSILNMGSIYCGLVGVSQSLMQIHSMLDLDVVPVCVLWACGPM
jgi:hypothetical protein